MPLNGVPALVNVGGRHLLQAGEEYMLFHDLRHDQREQARKVIAENESYTNEYSNNSENFDKISIIIFEFLKSNNIKIADISNIFVNHGPGKLSTLRSSIVICKALSLSNNIDFYGLSSKQMENINYNKLLDLLEKGALIRNIIKPVY